MLSFHLQAALAARIVHTFHALTAYCSHHFPYEDDQEETNPEESLPCSLSGLHTLYTGIDEPNSTLVDMETIWGQVDLQNNTLLPRLKKLIRKLAKSSDEDEGIRVLDMSDFSDVEDEPSNSEEEDSDAGSAASNMEEGSAASNLDNDQGEISDEEMDDDARRIRDRMEKVSLVLAVINDNVWHPKKCAYNSLLC